MSGTMGSTGRKEGEEWECTRAKRSRRREVERKI